MSSNIVFYKFIYSPITSFSFDGLSEEERLQKHIQSLKQKELETENEDYSIRFLKRKRRFLFETFLSFNLLKIV